MAVLEPLESLLVSKSGKESQRWKSVAFVLIAAYLFTTAGWQLRHDGVTQKALLNLLLGACSLVVIKYEKRVYVSPQGFVKETHTWFSHHRELLPWSEIRHVTLMIKGGTLIAFLEKDSLGWKLLFDRNEMAALDGIVKKYAPRVPLKIRNDMNSRF
ncbi:MAG: hypothetical protein Q4D58_05620 [Synergistaceae bacterium]|nr:hypothetical protein [Synergistaceae bacterium]